MQLLNSSIFPNAVILLEGIAAFLSILYIGEFYKRKLIIFPIILFSIVSVEIISSFNYPYKQLVYNLLALLTFGGYSYLFHSQVLGDKYKTIIKSCLILYVIAVFANACSVNILTTSHQFSYVIGGCLMIIFPVIYFLSLLNNSKTLILKEDIVFWIGIGLLLFYVGYLPIKIFRFLKATENNFYPSLRAVQLFLVILMNVSFILGCLWMKKK